ncbi:NYN domain-containing protein [Candidatus Bathyarchaeota archaeon]|nr:NYN domain-containing protein [Candidatus Bathyarchaeota archaeon]
MGRPAFTADPARPASGFVRIYIDNSNLWIQGQKTFAEWQSHRDPLDPTWRFDVGRLKAVLLENSGLLPEEEELLVTVKLYGSTPPPVDSVWKAIESHNVEVNTFARSSWTGREKEVDAEIIADSVSDASDDYHDAVGSVFIIVSGDRDIARAVQKISHKYQLKVHVWSWKNALSSIYSQRQASQVAVHVLDNHLNDIGFHETAFRLDRNILDPHSIVVIDALPKADEIRDFRVNLRISTYQYVSKGKGTQNLIIIPAFAHRMTYNEKADLFREASGKLRALGLVVIPYQEYKQRHGGEPDIILETSNRFEELPGGKPAIATDSHDGDNGDEHDEPADDGDGYTEIKKHAKKQQERLKIIEQKSRSRCDWRVYCRQNLECKYGHTKPEENYFRL